MATSQVVPPLRERPRSQQANMGLLKLGFYHSKRSPRRPQCLVVKQGTMTIKESPRDLGIASQRNQPQSTTEEYKMTSKDFYSTSNMLAAPDFSLENEITPRGKFFFHAGQVLRFFAYIARSHRATPRDQRTEYQCVTIHYYLQDDTIEVIEKATDNNMSPGGKMYKKGTIPVWDADHGHPCKSGESLCVDDFHVGADVCIYGQMLHIYDCDGFTRQMLLDEAPAEEVPMEQSTHHAFSPSEARLPNLSPHQAQSGYGFGVRDASIQELNNGPQHNGASPSTWGSGRDPGSSNQVFFVSWDDGHEEFSQTHLYVLHYFLDTGKIELKELTDLKGGTHFASTCPTMLQKQLALKHGVPSMGVDFIGKDPSLQPGSPGLVNLADLEVGNMVEILGRSMKVCGANESTYQWWTKNLGIDMRDKETDMQLFKNQVQRQAIRPHPPLKEEGSRPKRHTLREFVKESTNQGKTLRFLVKPREVSKMNMDHVFILTYFPEDDSLAIYFRPSPGKTGLGLNQGVFLSRCSPINPDTAKPYGLQDLTLGGYLKVPRMEIEIYEVDDYSLKYLAQNIPSTWSLVSLLQRLKQAAGVNEAEKSRLEAFLSSKPAGCETSCQELADVLGLEAAGFEFTKQEMLLMTRKLGGELGGLCCSKLKAALQRCVEGEGSKGTDGSGQEGIDARVTEDIDQHTRRAHAVELTGIEDKHVKSIVHEKVQQAMFDPHMNRTLMQHMKKIGITLKDRVNQVDLARVLQPVRVIEREAGLLIKKFCSFSSGAEKMTYEQMFDVIRAFLTAKNRGEFLGISSVPSPCS